MNKNLTLSVFLISVNKEPITTIYNSDLQHGLDFDCKSEASLDPDARLLIVHNMSLSRKVNFPFYRQWSLSTKLLQHPQVNK